MKNNLEKQGEFRRLGIVPLKIYEITARNLQSIVTAVLAVAAFEKKMKERPCATIWEFESTADRSWGEQQGTEGYIRSARVQRRGNVVETYIRNHAKGTLSSFVRFVRSMNTRVRS